MSVDVEAKWDVKWEVEVGGRGGRRIEKWKLKVDASSGCEKWK
jgi:hypothetical protein